MSTEHFLNFQETEYVETKLSHLDFSNEEVFDYKSETVEINKFLLSKRWDLEVDKQNNMTIINDIKTLNLIFEEVFDKFHSRVDAVELFHIISSFYSIEPEDCFKKLLSKYRKILVKDLETRIGSVRNIQRFDKDQENMKLTFKSVFN